MRRWVFQSSLMIATFELVLFILWNSNVLAILGDSIASILMRIGQALSFIGVPTSLASVFTSRIPQVWISIAVLFICVFAFWRLLWLSFWIGGM